MSEPDNTETDKQQARNREAMPEITDLIDRLRKIDPDLKVTFASENGVTIDKRKPWQKRIDDNLKDTYENCVAPPL